MAHYIFNFANGDTAKLREDAARFLRARMWSIDAGEPHSSALSPGDLVLIYVAAPAREFVGRADLASVVHDWTPSEAQVYPGDSPGGVLLTHVDEWDPVGCQNSVRIREITDLQAGR